MTQERLPLVSVIVPSFNNGRFIESALDSYFQQTYPEENREIIVVDDGSTDSTSRISCKYRGKILYIHQRHGGIASARNTGIANARGEIITFLDSDDLWHEERLQRVVERFRERSHAGMVYHPVELIDSEGHTINKNFYAAFGYEEGLSGWVGNEIASGKIFSGGSSFAFRKDIVNMFSPIPEDLRRGVDYYMAVISSYYATAEYIPEILGKYRLHKSNVTMMAGWDDHKRLSIVNKDFAYTRQKVIERIMNSVDLYKTINLNMLRRIQTKELIFFHVLAGKRLEAIKQIPALFKGSSPLTGLLHSIAVSFMALFIPASLYPKMVRAYGFLKRYKIKF